MKLSKETKVGLLAAVAIVLVILGLNFLKGANIFSSNTPLYAFYMNVDGLGASNPVMMYGTKVGQVDEIVILNQDSPNVMVRFHISGDIKIPHDSRAHITSDLLGSKSIVIQRGVSNMFVSEGDTLFGSVQRSLAATVEEVVAPVQTKVEKLLVSVDTVVNALNEVFNEETKTNLRKSFTAIRTSLQNVQNASGDLSTLMAEQTPRLKAILYNIESITYNLKNDGAKISMAVENVKAMTDTVRAMNLKKTVDELNATLASLSAITSKIDKGEGSLGLLVNDEKLYNDLSGVSTKLNALLDDIKANPGEYLQIKVAAGAIQILPNKD